MTEILFRTVHLPAKNSTIMGNSFDRGGASSSENSNSNTPHIVRRQQPKLSHQHISNKLNFSQKGLIKQAWEASKRTDVSSRIYKRVFEKRPELKEVFDSIGPNAWNDEAKRFGEFMDMVVCQLDDMHEIERLSLDMGRRHGQWRTHGFKSDFWVIFAESMTTECLYLDAGVHPAPDVLGAWATLISVIFGWVRDGYYEKLRLNRRLSRKSSKSTPSSSRSYSGSRTSSMDDNTGSEVSALFDSSNSKVTWFDRSVSVGQSIESGGSP